MKSNLIHRKILRIIQSIESTLRVSLTSKQLTFCSSRTKWRIACELYNFVNRALQEILFEKTVYVCMVYVAIKTCCDKIKLSLEQTKYPAINELINSKNCTF